MTFEELTTVLTDVIDGDRIGRLVSLRVHVQMPESAPAPIDAIRLIVRGMRTTFDPTNGRIRGLGQSPAAQLSVSLEAEDGRTLCITAGRGSVEATRLQLLAIGSRGIARLEDVELDDWPGELASAEDDDLAASWRADIERCLQRSEAVPSPNP